MSEEKLPEEIPIMKKRNKLEKLPITWQYWREILNSHNVKGVLKLSDKRYPKLRKKYEDKLTELGIKFTSKLNPPKEVEEVKDNENHKSLQPQPDYLEIGRPGDSSDED